MCAKKPGARCETSIVNKQQSLLKKLQDAAEAAKYSPSDAASYKVSCIQQEVTANTIDYYATPSQQKILISKKDSEGFTFTDETNYRVGLERNVWQSTVPKQLNNVKSQYSDEAEGVLASKRTAEFMLENLNYQLEARISRKELFLKKNPLPPQTEHHKNILDNQMERYDKEIVLTRMNISDLKVFINESSKKFSELLPA